MARAVMETRIVKLAGLSDPICTANSEPERLPMAAPVPKANSLYFTVLIPMASATCSSSRMAFHARPTLELARRVETNSAAMQNPRAR